MTDAGGTTARETTASRRREAVGGGPIRKFLIGTAMIVFATACSGTGPVQRSQTGRTQLLIFSEAQMNATAQELFDEVKATSALVHSGPRFDAVQRVGASLAEISGRPDYRWEFILIDQDTEVNAWAMPGGKVAVYTGILPLVQNEAGLAAVVGHEISHALAQHSNERASQGAVQDVIGSALESRLGGSSKKNAWMTVFGVGSTVGILLPYSRAQESEADEMGLMMMARAGYDPSEAPALWDRMAASSRRGVPQFLSTHPDPAGRAAELRRLLPEAIREYDAARVKRPSTPIR